MPSNYSKTVNEFIGIEPARRLIRNAIKEILPSKGNYFAFNISLAAAIGVSFLVGFSTETVTLIQKISELLLSMQLSIFGCVFAVYSIITAFLSDEFIKHLADVDSDGDNGSMLKNSTRYYESVLFLYFMNIGITGLILMAMNCISPMFRLSDNIILDTVLAIILTTVYLWISFRIFYEVKSTIYNTIVLFRSSIAYRFVDYSKVDDDNSGK